MNPFDVDSNIPLFRVGPHKLKSRYKEKNTVEHIG